ncbi:MAG: carboxypeptidase-like regulatory domain-containing protein, partial [Arenibacter latericius]|nr:carboxypeptidase-like regulatory domain-containing protein [Arenibacter latericius]
MRKTLLSILCAMAVFSMHSQNSLGGQIIEKATNEPLEQVSVYFPDLEKGGITTVNGEYKLNNLP